MTFISFLDCLIFAVTMFAGAYILVWCDIAMNGGLKDNDYGKEEK